MSTTGMSTHDLDAVRDRSRRYLDMGDQMDWRDKLPGWVIAAIGLAASLSAADVPDLLDEIDRLTGTASASHSGLPQEEGTHQQ